MVAGVLVLLGCIRLRRSEPRWVRGVSFGGGGIIVASGLGAAAAFGAAKALERIHAALPQGGWPGSSGLYAFAIVMLALSVALGTWTLARRWVSAAAAQLGALFVWEVLAMIIAWKAPGASFLFVWPLLGAAGAALVGLWRVDTRVVHLTSWAATLVAAAVIVPMIYTVAIVIFGVVGPGAATLGLFVPLTAWLLAPRLEELTAGRRWASPIAALAVAFLFLAIGLATVRRSDRAPRTIATCVRPRRKRTRRMARDAPRTCAARLMGCWSDGTSGSDRDPSTAGSSREFHRSGSRVPLGESLR